MSVVCPSHIKPYMNVGPERELMLRSHVTFDFWFVMPMKIALNREKIITEVVSFHFTVYTCSKNKDWNNLQCSNLKQI